MTTLTLIPDPSDASVVVSIGAAPTGALTISRTDRNGTGTVRLLAGQVPISGSLTVRDYEAALTGTLRYDVVDKLGATTTASTDLDMAGSMPRIGDVQRPSVRASALLVDYDSVRDSGTVVHRPIDRPDPVVIASPARTREGRLVFRAGSFEEARAIETVLSPGRRVMFRQADHSGMDMFCMALSVSIKPSELLAEGWVFPVDVSYVEIKSPALPLLGSAGWDFAAVTAGYPDFAAVRSAFTDFVALTIGPIE